MNFLDMLRNNPRGWGNGPGPEPEIAYQDDGGNLYGFDNALVRKAPAPHQGFGDQSLTDMLIGIGSAPAKMAVGLASGLSPYGSEGFQVPPLAADAWEAINAPGTILNEGMTPQDRDRNATNAAGFMMGGGLVAPKAGNALSSGAVRDYGQALYRSARHPGEPAINPPNMEAWQTLVGLENKVRSAEQLTKAQQSLLDDFSSGKQFNDTVPLDGGEAGYLNAIRRQNLIDSGSLYSNGSKQGAAIGASLPLENKGFTAYHGSPHDFDKFSLDKIGTGEGAQAYGHGLYFADNEAVAKSYRDGLSGVAPTGKFDPTNPQDLAASFLSSARGDKNVAAMLAKREADQFTDPQTRQFYDSIISSIETDAASPFSSTGKMYQVRINADPNDFLDWDKPLSQQSEAVQSLVQKDPMWIPPLNEAPDNLMRNLLRDPETTNKLREAGVPGVRYLDGNSRGAGEGSSNYVVFDESLIDILRKYGLTGGTIGAGALNSLSQDPTTYRPPQPLPLTSTQTRG